MNYQIELVDKSNSIINKLAKLAKITPPSEIDQIEGWCFQVLGILGISNEFDTTITVQSDIDCSEIKIDRAPVHRSPPLWVGEPSSFFGKDARNGDVTKTFTDDIVFYKLSNVTVLYFSEFGPVFFDRKLKIIENISTPYYPLLNLLKFDVYSYLDENVNKKTAGCAIFDRFWEINYAHSLLDQIPRLIGLNYLTQRKADVLVTKLRSKWQNSLLSKYLANDLNVVELDRYEAYFYESLIVSKDVGRKVHHPVNKIHPISVSYIRSKFSDVDSHKKNVLSVLVVCRKGSREVRNIYELVESFQKSGFVVTVLDCTDINVSDQWAYFNQASVVVAAHGAALANAIFMKKNSILVEILPETYANPAFWMISCADSITYIGVTDVVEIDSDGLRPRLRNVLLNPSAISGITHMVNEILSDIR